MLSSAIVSLVQKQYPDWSETMICEILNEIQRLVFTQNATPHMRMYGVAGKDPILTTVAGTYEYNINTGSGFTYNAWRVTDVYSSSIDAPTDVIKLDADPVTGCAVVIFKEDPGTANYYIKAYKLPPQITSSTIQLSIPHSYHLSHVFEGVCGFIEKFRSGKSERYDIFMKLLLPEMVYKISNPSLTGDFKMELRGY